MLEKYSWAAISLLNNFEIILDKFPRAEKITSDGHWRRLKLIYFTCNHYITTISYELFGGISPNSSFAALGDIGELIRIWGQKVKT